MLFSLLISGAAGFATPYAEPHVEKLLKDLPMDEMAMKEGEVRILTFVLLLLGAAILLSLSGSGGSAFLVVLGGGLGIFGTRLIELGKKTMAARQDGNEDSDK